MPTNGLNLGVHLMEKYSKNCISFQHYAPQFLQKLDILQKHFKLEEKDVEVEDKGTVSIFSSGFGTRED